MFNIIIMVIGLFEFCIGCILTIFSKFEKVRNFTKFLYDFSEEDDSVVGLLNKWIGQNYALVGSCYIFGGSLARMLNLKWILLTILIVIVEFYSYTRINKGIMKILNGSQ